MFCIQSIFRSLTSAKHNMPVCANRVCQQSGMRQMWAGSGQMYSFSSERGRLSGADCRGWLPHIPPVWRGEAEVEQDMFGMDWGGGQEKGCQKQMWPPPPFPPLCPCLNKSCSRSFYLHMLTGTSEFPEEKCREKKMGKKKKDRDIRRKSYARHCCKRLKRAFHKPWCKSDQTLQLQFGLSYSHSHRNSESIQEGDEIAEKNQVKQRCLCIYWNYYERWRIWSWRESGLDIIVSFKTAP